MSMRDRTFARLLGLFLFSVLPVLAWAGDEANGAGECHELKLPVRWNFCVYRGEDDGARVVYFFHGLGGSEKSWSAPNGVGALLRDQWKLDGVRRPTVVTVSFGPQWLIAPRNGSKFGGLLEAFPTLVVPTVERKLPKVPDERVLLGESMGGFNATQVAFKLPKLFARVAVLCPPITEISPFADEAAITKFVEETGAKRELVEGAAKLSQAFFPTEEAWSKAAPLGLVAEADKDAIPPMQVSCGNRDEYGFYPGARKFGLVAKERELPVEWRPLLAAHCAMDTKSTADFLLAR
jgi:pimeloyl-ACP methyl ester carboxylesterase